MRAAAAKRYQYMQVEGQVAKLLRDADLPEQHPIDGLLEVVRHAGAMMRFLGNLTGRLDADPGTLWTTVQTGARAHRYVRWADKDALVGYDHEGDQAADVLVSLYERWAALYMKACKTAIDADLDERMVRNATATSEAFLNAVHKGLIAADMSAQQQELFKQALADDLRDMSMRGLV